MTTVYASNFQENSRLDEDTHQRGENAIDSETKSPDQLGYEDKDDTSASNRKLRKRKSPEQDGHAEKDNIKPESPTEEEKAAKRKKLDDEKAALKKKQEEEKELKRRQAEEEKLAKKKQLEEEKEAKRKKLEEEKEAKRKKLEEEKEAKRKKLEEEKEAKRKKLEEEKEAKRKKLEEEKEAKRKKLEEEKEAKRRKLEEEKLERERKKEEEKLEKERKRKEEQLQREQKKQAELQEKERRREEREKERLEKKLKIEEEKRAKELERQKAEEEKRKAEEAKERSQMRISSFFQAGPAKKTDVKLEEKQVESDYESLFLPFFVQKNVTLKTLGIVADATEASKKELDLMISNQGKENESKFKSFLQKSKLSIPVHRVPTTPESILSALNSPSTTEQQIIKLIESLDPIKFISFYENSKPPYTGTWTSTKHQSQLLPILSNPLDACTTGLDYDYDSDLEWNEEDKDGDDIDDEDEDEDDGVGLLSDEEDDEFIENDQQDNKKRNWNLKQLVVVNKWNDENEETFFQGYSTVHLVSEDKVTLRTIQH
ncbi:chromatin assembly factor-I (CAF-I) p90 subunit [Lodderomyces elongisporus]|uniref:chromatin assembly factor-I (CAF-I) p90 subunit n=1 Tax=Lodderomyces elongisporus TaxID=36914 RepID=UPI00291CB7C3|nr:chromatin assembly factor-I (CAF-I) p90 subunit [Lodderomyces elongisporus]WLF80119.1 chromatin assembly factor-I (CAF-I) p90 subunit [Lodderomyces elongisporus]